MKFPKAFFLVGLSILLLSVPAVAQDDYPKGELFGGFSYYRTESGDDAFGFQTSISGNFHKNVGITGEFGAQFDSVGGTTVQVYEVMAGPRFTARSDGLTGFLHALFGAEQVRFANFHDTGFAMAFGGGVDINAGRRFAIRVIQLDYVPNRFSGVWFHDARASAGIVIKFGG